MTLCIAWPYGDFLALASDSRITVQRETDTEPAVVVDAGVKLSRIMCTIYTPGFPSKAPAEVDRLEMACLFAGSTLTAYAARDSIAAALQSLTYASTSAQVPVEEVLDIVEAVFRDVAGRFRKTFHEKARLEIFLALRSPAGKELHTISMKWASQFHPTIKRNVGFPTHYAFGDETAVAEINRLIEQNGNPLLSLIQIVEDKAFSSVGGGIQVGVYTQKGLTFHALDRNHIDPSNGQLIHEWGSLDFNQLNAEGHRHLFLTYPVLVMNNYSYPIEKMKNE